MTGANQASASGAVIVHDLRGGRLAKQVGDLAAMDTSPADVPNIAAARVLRDDLTCGLDNQPGNGTDSAEPGMSSKDTPGRG